MDQVPSGKVEELEIIVPWGVLALKCWNSADLSPVLVAHGLCENAGAFDRLIPLLPREFYYVAVDLPGHGYSSPFPRGLPLEFMNYVGQLQRIVTHFRWKKLILIGHSFGAHVLEFFAASYGQKVEKLILIDAISPTPVAREIFTVYHQNCTREAIECEEKDGEGSSLYTYEEALFHVSNGRMSRLVPDAAKRLLPRCLRRAGDRFEFSTDPRLRLEVKPALGEDVILDQLSRIRCPVLVVVAVDSEQFSLLNSPGFYAKARRILEGTHAESSLVRVPGNHCVHNNQPEIIAPIIGRFLRRSKSKF